MKILIVGASGLLGHELAEMAIKAGHEVYLLTRSDSNEFTNGKIIKQNLRELDYSKLPKVDSIYYLAQSKKFRSFPDDWDDIFEINVQIPLALMDWARKQGVKQFHLASSGGVYAGGLGALGESQSIDASRDINFYLASRLSCEILAKNFAPFFEAFSIVRPFFIYGKRQNRTMLIPRLVDSIKQGKEVFLNGELGIRINPIHVSNAADICLRLSETKGFGVFNLAGPEVMSIRDICEIIASKLSLKVNYSIKNEPADDLIGDTSKVDSILKKEMIDFNTGVSEML